MKQTPTPGARVFHRSAADQKGCPPLWQCGAGDHGRLPKQLDSEIIGASALHNQQQRGPMKITTDDWRFRPPDNDMLVVDVFLNNGQHAVLEVCPMKNTS